MDFDIPKVWTSVFCLCNKPKKFWNETGSAALRCIVWIGAQISRRILSGLYFFSRPEAEYTADLTCKKGEIVIISEASLRTSRSSQTLAMITTRSTSRWWTRVTTSSKQNEKVILFTLYFSSSIGWLRCSEGGLLLVDIAGQLVERDDLGGVPVATREAVPTSVLLYPTQARKKIECNFFMVVIDNCNIRYYIGIIGF